MVVDDEPNASELARAILEPAGYQVLRASSGPSAISQLEAGTAIDLLIADLSMPDMDGAEMVRRIRRMRPDLKVLYVTGFIDSLMNLRPLWEGEAFIEKPVTIAGLREAVAFLLYGTATKPPTSYENTMAPMTADEKKRIFLDALEHWGIGPSGGAVALTVLRAAFAMMKSKLGVEDKHAFIDAIERAIEEEPNLKRDRIQRAAIRESLRSAFGVSPGRESAVSNVMCNFLSRVRFDN
jgi:CheY-like chemotaxis protein